MQRVSTWSTKVPLSVYWIGQVPRQAHAQLGSSHEMHASQAHFHNCFACCPYFPVQEFCSYRANFLHLWEAEAASCEGFVTEAGWPQQITQTWFTLFTQYLRLPHMFVPILMDIFNHWFAQRAIPGSITKCVITLLKKGGRHVWEELDNYRFITLLNIELKILARILANCLQLVISDLIGPEQNYTVKGKINLRQLALGARDPRGVKRQHQSRADQFRSVQGLW